MASIASIKPFLWFDREAEEAATFYASVFNGSSTTAKRYPEGARLRAVMRGK